MVAAAALAADLPHEAFQKAVVTWSARPISELRDAAARADATKVDLNAIAAAALARELSAQEYVFFLSVRYRAIADFGRSAQALVLFQLVQKCPPEWTVDDVRSFAHGVGWEVPQARLEEAFARRQP